MRKTLVGGLGALAACLSLAICETTPASAQAMASPAPMAPMTIDCSKAGDMMMQAGKMNSSAAMTGDVDKDFVVVGMNQEKGMMMMMQVEMACGKDPKVKAAAAKSMHESEMRLQMFHDQGQS